MLAGGATIVIGGHGPTTICRQRMATTGLDTIVEDLASRSTSISFRRSQVREAPGYPSRLPGLLLGAKPRSIGYFRRSSLSPSGRPIPNSEWQSRRRLRPPIRPQAETRIFARSETFVWTARQSLLLQEPYTLSRADDTLWDRRAFWPPLRGAFPRIHNQFREW
jgi:hypothetical protein